VNIRCHGCGRVFRVRQERLPPTGARTRCPRCRELLVIPPAGSRPGRAAPSPGGRGAEEALFDLPPAELGLEEQVEDLFGVTDGARAVPGGVETEAEAVPDAARSGTGTSPKGSAPTGRPEMQPGPDAPPPRPRSLLGWIARLFGSEP
jgi:predicted Zn finger-like uncharacterized protein